MRNRIMIICTLLLFVSCNQSNNKVVIKTNNLNKSQTEDYYTISNVFGKDTILKDNDEKEIIIEKVILDQKINGMNVFIGNIMGSKSAVFTGMNKSKLVFSEEIGYIKSYSLKRVDNIDFILLVLNYEDVCSYIENTIIYSCYNNKIYQCFDIVSKEEYYDEDSICLGGNSSSIKKLDINKIGSRIIINLQKDNDELSEYTYDSNKNKFVLSVTN